MPNAGPPAALPAVAVVAADRRVRDSVASLLMAGGGCRVVGCVGDVAGALEVAGDGRADVFVVDRDLADGTSNGHAGLPFVALLRREAPKARILVIAWNGPAAPYDGDGADAVLDLGEQPASLLEAVLEPPDMPRRRTPGTLRMRKPAAAPAD